MIAYLNDFKLLMVLTIAVDAAGADHPRGQPDAERGGSGRGGGAGVML